MLSQLKTLENEGRHSCRQILVTFQCRRWQPLCQICHLIVWQHAKSQQIHGDKAGGGMFSHVPSLGVRCSGKARGCERVVAAPSHAGGSRGTASDPINPTCLLQGLGELHGSEDPCQDKVLLHISRCLWIYAGVRYSITKNTPLGKFDAGLLQQ